MLRERTRSVHKDQSMSDSSSGIDFLNPPDKAGKLNKTNHPLFSVPGLFVGLSSKALSDSDSVRSPTSPLEFRVITNVGNNSFRCPIAVHDGHHKGRGCGKVGLGIVDSLDDDGKILRPSESKNILFGPRIRTKTSSCKRQGESYEASKSLPKSFAMLSQTKIKSPLQKGSYSDVIFEIGDAPLVSKAEKVTSRLSDSVDNNAGHNRSLGSGNICLETVPSLLNSSSVTDESLNLEKPLKTQLNSANDGLITGSISASEIELSEDYTCVISHGPNPKTTHIFCDCVLEDCQAKCLVDSSEKEEEIGLPQAFPSSEVPPPYPSNDFMSFCHLCNKKLEDDQDIYIYRGDTAFCSMECRCEGIFIEEEKEKSTNKSDDTPKSDKDRKLFETGIFVEL